MFLDHSQSYFQFPLLFQDAGRPKFLGQMFLFPYVVLIM